MDYDVIIIGAGMSGLAAGIRLAYFGKRVCILEKHYAFGGLNSYYRLDGRDFDVGLHAVTNFVGPGVRGTPLPKLLRQLRMSRNDFDLHPQRFSEIRFPGVSLRFTNDLNDLIADVAEKFPAEADRFRKLCEHVRNFDDVVLLSKYQSTRETLKEFLHEPMLIEMLLCPIMYYGSAEEHDMDFLQFVIIFKSLYCEGFARPRDGVRKIIKALVKKFRSCGGELRMQTAVERLDVADDCVTSVVIEGGETLTCTTVLSSAGYVETMGFCGDGPTVTADEVGRVSFVETIAVLDKLPQHLGHEAAIVFFNDCEKFTYAMPEVPVDLRSGVVCCPSNYEGHDDMSEGLLRMTWLANSDVWMADSEETYRQRKIDYLGEFKTQARRYVADFDEHFVVSDMFTPRTIQRFTGRVNGAVYGSPRKRRDGRTHLKNLFLCGTDQGYLGIIGALLSGITIANMHVLAEE
ncbi:NAD(P)/FAD-dependent oxidoreductase [bacterium AH-315-J04]|nr:NAD(P)/FAD-dependent oxidoreductase [bacterium AH-315-J04]